MRLHPLSGIQLERSRATPSAILRVWRFRLLRFKVISPRRFYSSSYLKYSTLYCHVLNYFDLLTARGIDYQSAS
jgi:hypothetical protein